MKKTNKIKKRALLVIISFLFSFNFSFAQDVQSSIDALSEQTNAIITVNKNSGIAQFVKFPHLNPMVLSGNTVFDKSISFLENHKGIYSLEDVSQSFINESTETDNYGFKRVVLIQVHEGVPVFDGKLMFHFNAQDKLTAINGNYIPGIKTNAVPGISPYHASSIAMETVHNQNINFSGAPLKVHESKLYVFQKGITQGYRGAHHLVYKIEVRNNTDVREFIFVDAHDGKIIEQYTGIAHAIDRTVYEGLYTGNSIVWEEGDPFPGDLTIWQQNEVIATGHTYNFFKNAFGYVSYDGADFRMHILNNVSDPGWCPNASWNGAYIRFCDGTATDDVIGHEWGHAYTEFTCGLIYAGESGAMNEAYSDIWGETIDLINDYEDEGEDHSLRTDCLSSDRWMLGEDASAFGGAIRDMWDPTCLGDPGKVSDDEFWCEAGDNGGVHTNSGVINHTYVLLVDGGDYNGQSITGIGFTKSAHIFWRAQSQYLTESSGFSEFTDAVEASATDLLGINLEGLSTGAPVGLSGEIITTDDLTQLANVLLATELRDELPEECTGTILQPLENDLCDAATTGLIFFEDWEDGFGDWTFEQLPVNPDLWVPRDWQLFNGPEDNRDGTIAYGPAQNYADCSTNGQEGIIRLISPIISMPDNSDPIFQMAFNHVINIEPGWDGANIKYSIDGGDWNLIESSSFIENTYNYSELTASENPLAGQPGFSGADGVSNPLTWGTSYMDLATLGVVSNSTLQFRFEVGTDRCLGLTGWGLDEIMIYDCNNPLSISDNDFENSIIAYPNPTSNLLNVEAASVISSVELMNILGQTLYAETLNTNKTQIDLSTLPTGNYFVRVTVDNTIKVMQIIKQ